MLSLYFLSMALWSEGIADGAFRFTAPVALGVGAPSVGGGGASAAWEWMLDADEDGCDGVRELGCV